MADVPYTFGLGPKSEHIIEAGDGKGGKVVVKNSSDSVVVVAISGDDATLTFELVEATRMTDLPHVKLDKALVLRKNHDPTAKQMMRLLSGMAGTIPTATIKHAECAMYWYAMLNHGGHGSNLYAAMSQSQYKPKLTSKLESEGPEVAAMYRKLCEEYD